MKPRSDMHRKMRSRNIAMLLVLLAFAILIAVFTYVKMSGAQ